jgi:hypothetical protein
MTELADTNDDQRWVLPVTSAHDGLEHLVTEDMMTIGTAGRYCTQGCAGVGCGRRCWPARQARRARAASRCGTPPCSVAEGTGAECGPG